MKRLEAEDLKNFNLLKHYRTIRKWACRNNDLTDAELALAQISGYWPEARELFKVKLKELEQAGFVFKLDFII